MSRTAPDGLETGYSWLVGPGDGLRVDDYTTPTRVKTWLQAKAVRLRAADRERAYGQWVAQLLQVQLGVPLVRLYKGDVQKDLPFKLRGDVIAMLDQYFRDMARKGKSR